VAVFVFVFVVALDPIMPTQVVGFGFRLLLVALSGRFHTAVSMHRDLLVLLLVVIVSPLMMSVLMALLASMVVLIRSNNTTASRTIQGCCLGFGIVPML
jgi:hypothetical protein